MTANERTYNGNNKTRTHSSYTEKNMYIFSVLVTEWNTFLHLFILR